MAATIELERVRPEPRVRGVVKGMQVTYRSGWRCTCGASHGERCRHMRAVARELSDPVYDAIEEESTRLGWSMP